MITSRFGSPPYINFRFDDPCSQCISPEKPHALLSCFDRKTTFVADPKGRRDHCILHVDGCDQRSSPDNHRSRRSPADEHRFTLAWYSSPILDATNSFRHHPPRRNTHRGRSEPRNSESNISQAAPIMSHPAELMKSRSATATGC